MEFDKWIKIINELKKNNTSEQENFKRVGEIMRDKKREISWDR